MVHEIERIRFHNNVMFAHTARWCRFFTYHTFTTSDQLSNTHVASDEEAVKEHDMLLFVCGLITLLFLFKSPSFEACPFLFHLGKLSKVADRTGKITHTEREMEMKGSKIQWSKLN